MESKLVSEKDFFKKYPNSKLEFDKSGLLWSDLEVIYEDHFNNMEDLQDLASLLGAKLMKISKVHSVRYRVKHPEHLIEKIIRKKAKNKKRSLSIDTYKKEITDLIGLRAIHLFKDDWITIHDSLLKSWNIIGKPIVNYREGDKIPPLYKEKGCNITKHPFGYRSIHYLVKSQSFKTIHIAELQVRTIYEEGWSEIDHSIRYPYETKNDLYNDYLSILNRLSGSADEMGTFILGLNKVIQDLKEQVTVQTERADQSEKAYRGLQEFADKINQDSTIPESEKEIFKENLHTINKNLIGSTVLDFTSKLIKNINVDELGDGFMPISDSVKSMIYLFQTQKLHEQLEKLSSNPNNSKKNKDSSSENPLITDIEAG